MKEVVANLIDRADLRPAEVVEIAGLAVTVISAIVSREIDGAEGLALYASIFTITSAARDIGARVLQGVSDKIVERKEKKVVAPSNLEAVGVKQ